MAKTEKMEYIGSRNYNIVRSIGNSEFSSTAICLVQHKRSLQPKALRQTNLENCNLECISFLQKELWVSRALSHKNILVHEAAFVERMMLYVVTEFMSYGSCSDLLESFFRYGLPENFVAYVLGEVLQALQYIHRLGFIHRAVKACHILVSGDGRVKLSGNRNMISMVNSEQRTQNVHDFPKHDTHLLPWLSPEILQQNMEGYDTLSDIYSLGITACELGNGHAPFTDMPSTQMLLAKLNGTKPCLLDNSTVPGSNEVDYCENVESHKQHEAAKTRYFSDSFHEFVSICLTLEPTERPTASQLLSHPFINCVAVHPPNLKELLHPLVPITPEMKVGPEDSTSCLLEVTNQIKNVSTRVIDWDFEVD